MADYKIELGIGLNNTDFNNIKTKIKSLEDDTVEIKLDTKKADGKIDDLKKQLQDLSKSNGKKPSLDINTTSLEESLGKVENIIKDIQKSLGSLDDKMNTKDLVSSVNQIAIALEKVTDESNGLLASLSALSKKDFSFNLNLKSGNSNPVQTMTKYGQAVTREAIPALKEQIAYLKDVIGKTTDADKALERYLVKQNKGFDGIRVKSSLEKQMSSGYDLEGNKVSKSDRMLAHEEYLGYLKEVAALNHIDLSGFNAKFSKSASDIVDDTTKIQTGAKEAEESLEKLKQVFGGGIDAEGLSTALEPITQDLKVISEFIDKLAKNNSIDGLTGSFNRLSETLEKLMSNATAVKKILDGSLTSANTGIEAKDVIPDSNEVIKSAEQVGKKIGDTIENAVEQSLDIDDVIDKEVDALMTEFGVKGKQAREDIKKALVNYRNNRNSDSSSSITEDENGWLTLDDDVSNMDELDMFGSHSTVSGIRQVTDAILENKTAVKETDKLYEDLLRDIQDVNSSKGLKKVQLLDMHSEWGDDYRDNKKLLGSWFSDKYTDAINISEWASDKSWASLIDFNTNHQDIANQIIQRIKEAKGIEKVGSSLSGNKSLEEERIKIEDVEAAVIAAADNIDRAEQKMAQSSTESANTIKQNQQEIRQEYEKTLAEKRQRLEEIDRESDSYANRMNNPDNSPDEMQSYMDGIDRLEQEKAEILAEIQQIETALESEAKQAQETANAVVQSANEQVQSIERVDNAVEKTNKQLGKPVIDVDDFADTGIEGTVDHIRDLEVALKRLGFSDSSIDNIIQDFENLNVTVDKIKTTLRGNTLSISASGTDQNKRSVQVSGSFAPDADGNLETGGFSTSVTQYFKETEESFKRMKSLAKEMGQIDIKLAGLDVDKDIDEIRSLQRVLDGLESEYNELYVTTAKDLSVDQIKELDKIFANTTGEIRDFKNELAEASNAQELTSGLERLKSITKEIASLKIDIFKFEDADNIERASNRLNELENEAAELRAELQRKFNITSFDEIDDIAAKGEKALSDLVSKVAEARNKLAEKIKIDIELGNYEDDLTSMYDKFNRLSSAGTELRDSVEKVEDAFKELNVASELNEDGVVDTERLIKAQKDYAAAIERTNNLISKQARAEAKDARSQQLQDNREVFQAKIDAWLAKNSAATEKFGDKLLELRAKAETADQVTLNHLNKELVKVDKAAEKAGLKMQSIGDRIKTKAKEYMAYFSVAEVFMEITQALKAMFNTVVEIDTAMTGLYRVTDLTASQYDTLFNNMISSAKEYGATLNDIINATTDWVRAGFEADTALGLAEVTTMYQHISDLDYDTAAENLITAYNGFKDELNGAFDGDTVSAVGYIADILNELDRHNCP